MEIEAHLDRCLKEAVEACMRLDTVHARAVAQNGIKYATQNEELGLLTQTARNCWAYLHYWKGVTHVGFIGTYTYLYTHIHGRMYAKQRQIWTHAYTYANKHANTHTCMKMSVRNKS